MFLLTADGVSLRIERREVLTSGAQNIYLCQFDFDQQWEGLDRTAVFQAQDVKVSVVLDGNGRCQIPYEVLRKPFVKVYAGVYGTKNGQIIMPTVLQDMGRVEKGVSLGEEAKEPSPDVYSQILANSNEALETARAVKADADAGKFDGVTPEIGENGNWFIGGVDTGKPSKGEDGFGAGEVGESGATFIPSVDDGGNLSWSNDKDLPNPATVNIKGPKGEKGDQGAPGIQGIPGEKGNPGQQGEQGIPGEKGEPGERGVPGQDGDTPVIGDNGNWYIGGVDTGKPSRGAPGASSGEGGTGENGATYTPYLDAAGNLSWSNDKGLDNPATVNIKGPKGDQGEKGEAGDDGAPGAKGEKGDPGAKGDPGEKGEPGADGIPGEKGADGHTPVKGTDYWTEEDQQSMVQQVLAALPDGDEVSY